MPGPKPNPAKPNSRHRQRAGRSSLVTLPAIGCELPAPRLPTGRKWSAAERKLWRELWASPQATQWDDSAAPAVAMLVVHVVSVLSGAGAAWRAREARALADALGLTPAGLAALGWQIGDEGAPVASLSVIAGGQR